MNYKENIAKLDEQIEYKELELSELRQKRRKLKIAEINKGKKPMPRGRPPTNEDILIEAVKLLETKTFSDVCLKLNLSKATLHRYGITRQALGGKTRLKRFMKQK